MLSISSLSYGLPYNYSYTAMGCSITVYDIRVSNGIFWGMNKRGKNTGGGGGVGK